MLALGNFRFGLRSASPDKLSKQSNWEWAQQERVSKTDAIEYTGKRADTLKIPGVIYPGQVGNADSLKLLTEMADEGVPYLLVDVAGWVRGMWSITGLQETRSYLNEVGAPLKIEFDLELKRYVD